jgi:predicted ATPase/DNA-binding SARP family transcriptional activator
VLFSVLGPLRVIDAGGVDVTPRGEQQRKVLAMLAISAPAPVSVDVLEELLWGGPAPSANALQALVSKLRKMIEPARIEHDPRGYALAGEFTTDVAEFEQLVALGDHVAAEHLVHGAPLADLADVTAVAADRARLAEMIRAARRKRIEALVDGPDPLAASAELEALVAAEPLEEGWWALLMRVQHGRGQQAEALRTFQRARRVLAEELGLSPGPELQQLERAVLQGEGATEAALPPTIRISRLPARLSSFVGRESDLAALADAVKSHRLVTLVGPGGTGKTTTALELVRRVAPAGGAIFVALAPLDDRDSIARALARAIGLPESEQTGFANESPGADRLDRVLAALATSLTTLVIDNCEHVIDAAADVVHRLLVDCPAVRVVATSRASLGVPGENVYPLPPLPNDDALELFIARAHDHAAGAAVDTADTDTLRALCDRLDRLPLAIELAAARLRWMTVPELIDRLDDRFTLLSAGLRTVEPRQQTLRAVVDWSHDLLDPLEQVVFRRLGVFVGGAAAAAVEFVADQPDAMSVLDRLLDKSLVLAEHTPVGMRYSMLQTLQDYASERLAESGEREHVVDRHAHFYAGMVGGALKGLVGHDQAQWLATIGRERQNIDAARESAIAEQDAQLALELITPMGWYFYMTGELEPGADAFAEALACPGPTDPGLRALALSLYGWLMSNGPNVERAVAFTSEAMAEIDRVDDPWARGMIANLHVITMLFAGFVERVRDALPSLERIAAESDDRWVSAVTKVVRGEVEQYVGDIMVAEQLMLEAADDFERVGDRFAYAITITEAAEVAEMFGQYDRAVDLLERGVELADEVGFSGHPLAMRARLANVEILRGNLDVAEAHHQLVADDPVAASVPWLQAMSLMGRAAIARRRDQFELAEHVLARAWELPRSKTQPHMRTLLLVARGYLADQIGDGDRALELQAEALRAAAGLGAPRNVAYALEGCAGALALADNPERLRLGAELLGAADRLRRENGGAMPAAERYDVDRAEGRLRAASGDVEFGQAFLDGAAADANDLVAVVEALTAAN